MMVVLETDHNAQPASETENLTSHSMLYKTPPYAATSATSFLISSRLARIQAAMDSEWFWTQPLQMLEFFINPLIMINYALWR